MSVRVTDSLRYAVVDVFTDRAFGGNPLAVVLGGEALDSDHMQQIAQEFNLSETAFPLVPTEDERASGADYVLRIFTPEVELPFAGHPSVGAAWWLGQLGWFPPGLVHQRCGAGLLPVEVTPRGATLTGGTPTVSAPIDPAPALEAVGLDLSVLADPEVRIATTGLAYAVLFVEPEALISCRPDLAALAREFSYPREATGVYVVSWNRSRRHARARMFAGDIGTPEDAATGSAALALGARLVARGDVGEGRTTFTIDQGVEMGRPSRLMVTCDVESGRASRLTVTGAAVLVAEGRIASPAG